MEIIVGRLVTLSSGTARGVGELDAIEGILPGWGAGLMSVLTQLGDFWFLTVVLGLCFVQLPRQRTEIVALFGTAFGGLGLYRTLKHTFESPRPAAVLVDPGAVPEIMRPLYVHAIDAPSYGFPSGHATTATILYGGLALVLALGTRRQRVAAAAGLIAVVCFSRLALGVHNLVDVVGGVATGLLALGVLFVLPGRYAPDRRVFVTLGAAVALAGAYFLASDGSPVALLTAGVALATMVGWRVVEN